ncbi:efflux RND transporter permease subunit [Paracidobacterium acidisoli]|uniref:Efflux RND transporter permease subunit n=1 Tax=Paracidobacterium acidisoli TaxID=2303751 RepID=A0A372IS29_9BACT|nr:CusA/CzcA family heavy metal efflux RND transporter [Paracidobacterium acidisoli]MBT9330649.1 CusA/CzcA family heavy metal efflux RND transporter [Paracidobacterium acidisoli]
MQTLIRVLLRYRNVILILFLAGLAIGIFAFRQLDIEAYPDPSPPMVEFITQNPSWSAEEMEQQVTIPLETGLNGTPRLDQIRSISIFGLSDVKMYFTFDSDYFVDRQEALNRIQQVNLPNNLQPQLSPESPIGEIYRYELTGAGYSLNELKATQDWLVVRQIKQVPGIIDVATFGGSTRQYQAEVDPNKLLTYGVTMTQVVNAVQNSNANAGGNYLTLGSQSVNVRGIGLLHSVDDMKDIVVAEHNGVPVLLSDVAAVQEGHQPRLGKVGRDGDPDIVEGIVLLQKNEKSLPALAGLREKIHQLNHGNLLPPGMQIKTLYDRTTLINTTTTTVRHVIITGLILVTLVLLSMLGDLRITFIAAITIPFAVLFSFTMMVLTNHSANLISIGAIDFGILVDASIVVLENVHRKVSRRVEGEEVGDLITEGVGAAAKPVLFATLIILVAFIPLFTMQGVPGKIFAPMSVTYGFALTGALIFALIFAPVLGAIMTPKKAKPHAATETWLSAFLRRHYDRGLRSALRFRKTAWMIALACLIGAVILFKFVGGEFMPALEEGNLWIRATMQQDVSFQTSSNLADDIRDTLRAYPEISQVISQMGRPDDGTDVSTFNNIEFLADLKPASQWRPEFHGNKDALIAAIQSSFKKYPGIDFNFSQNIQDNVEEAMSGVKGENSLKLFGSDFDQLTQIADKIQGIMKSVPGITDVGVFDVTGQPSLMISIDRAKAARYGLQAQDINNVVQAAVGGAPVTQIIDGDRRFDFSVRYAAQYRDTPDAISRILVATPDGNQVPLGAVANVTLHNGAFMIYHEGGRRYIPIKFSVRGRDLASAIQDLQSRMAQQIKLPTGYEYTWAGEFDSLRKEQARLAFIIPVSLVVILVLLYIQFRTWRDAFIVVGTLPFAAIGGILTLFLTHTSFSISAAVGFTSLTGVATLGAVVFLSGIRRAQREEGFDHGLEKGCLDEMRPVVMACMAAGLGLLPAAVTSEIGAQAQQPLARVVVGGMVTTVFAILFVMPLLVRRFSSRDEFDHGVSE